MYMLVHNFTDVDVQICTYVTDDVTCICEVCDCMYIYYMLSVCLYRHYILKVTFCKLNTFTDFTSPYVHVLHTFHP